MTCRLCAKFDVCTRLSYGASDYKALAKNKPRCFEACPDFPRGRLHIELRRIFEKDMPFDSIEQQHVNLAMSHINSLTRDTLDGKCAYDAFVEEFGEDGRPFLEKLGIVRIPANQVTLHPFLLGEKFQKLADRTIL